jgi:hypothetical protein
MQGFTELPGMLALDGYHYFSIPILVHVFGQPSEFWVRLLHEEPAIHTTVHRGELYLRFDDLDGIFQEDTHRWS